MKPRKLIFGSAALLLVFLGSAVLIWSIWPVARQRAVLVVPPDRLVPLAGEDGGRQIVLEYPAAIRLGDSAQVNLSLDPILLNREPTNSAASTPKAHAEVETHLDFTGLPLSPADLARTALLPEKPARFTWTLWPYQDGNYAGRAWVRLQIIPTDGSSEEDRAISAQPLQLSVYSLVGLSTPIVRILGAVSLALGVLIGVFVYVKIRSFS